MRRCFGWLVPAGEARRRVQALRTRTPKYHADQQAAPAALTRRHPPRLPLLRGFLQQQFPQGLVRPWRLVQQFDKPGVGLPVDPKQCAIEQRLFGRAS